MAQLTNPKIEELRGRLSADPKSRLFYQLAEELRRGGEFREAEHVLRSGLSVYPAYLAAWVSLGRVLREQKKELDAVDALNKALQLDPSNVVAARLLADAFLELGEKREALKKYKLVHALIPADEALRNTIERLESEVGDEAQLAAPPPAADISESVLQSAEPDRGAGDAPAPEPLFEAPQPLSLLDAPDPLVDESPIVDSDAAPEPRDSSDLFEASAAAAPFTAASPESGDGAADFWSEPASTPADPRAESADAAFEEADRIDAPGERLFEETGDAEPMYLAHDESPFEEPVQGFGTAAVEIESPLGVHVDMAPVSADVPAPVVDEETAATADLDSRVPVEELFPVTQEEARRAGAEASAAVPGTDSGVSSPAKPDRSEFAPVDSEPDTRVARLERWLSKVGRKEVSGV